MVEGKHHEADERDHHHADAVHEQRGHRLLHRSHLEEAVDDVGGVAAVEGGDLGPGEVVGEGVGRAHEEPALQAFDDVQLHRAQGGGEGEKHEHHAGQHDHRPELHAGGDGVDEGLDGRRRDDREDADGGGEQGDDPDVVPLEPQGIGESRQGPLVRGAVCVGMGHGDTGKGPRS